VLNQNVGKLFALPISLHLVLNLNVRTIFTLFPYIYC